MSLMVLIVALNENTAVYWKFPMCTDALLVSVYSEGVIIFGMLMIHIAVFGMMWYVKGHVRYFIPDSQY